MNQKVASSSKAISPLVIADGFVHGWAFDPLRSSLDVVLSVDGIDASTGLTGHPVSASFYALAVPPHAHCGFCLPLPLAARDGRAHKLVVRVSHWQALPAAPRAELQWYHGPCLGEVSLNPQGWLEGWVGLRQQPGKLPPVLVSDGQQVRFVITPTPEPVKKLDGCAALLKFRVEQSRFSDIVAPVFSCLGVELPLRAPQVHYKVVGHVEVDHEGIRGVAYNSANPAESLDLLLIIDDLPHAQLRPNKRQPEIARHLKLVPAEVGICGFDINLPRVLKDGKPHTLAIRCLADGSLLNPKPLHYQHRKPGLELDLIRALLGKARATPHWIPAFAGMTGWKSPSWFNSPSFRRKPESSEKATAAAANPLISSFRRKPESSDPPQVSVIILNRNGSACLDQLFASLLQHNTVPLELIVIDHASADDSLAVLERWSQHLPLRVEALDQNFSFSASCNRGARLAKTPHLLFLNNDIVWLQDALPPMLDTLQDPQVGLVGLRLLKTQFAKDNPGMAWNSKPEVQHLGVRFVLHDDQYWPFEANPDTENPAAQYSPQVVPVVTGAVLLCRRAQFLKAGGFDEGYVYGFEDVELCLRMGSGHSSQIARAASKGQAALTAGAAKQGSAAKARHKAQQGLAVVCRNDLVALHHHGYTRLTGREPGMSDHQVDNQQRLADRLGLWLKRGFWQSLLAGDALLTSETFTVGIAVAVHGSNLARLPGGNGAALAAADKAQLTAALDLAEALVALYPHARLLFLTSDHDWDYLGDCHVLVALSPQYDLRAAKQARGDLRTACYLYDPEAVAAWNGNPGLPLFDAAVFRHSAEMKKAVKELASGLMLEPSTTEAPLGKLLDAERLRVLVRHAARDVPLQLAAALKAQGALVQVQELKPAATGSGGSSSKTNPAKVADVIITVFNHALLAQDTHFQYQRRADAINVLWIIDGADNLRPQDIAQADQVWTSNGALPAHLKKAAKDLRAMGGKKALVPSSFTGLARHLQQSVGDKIGRSFHTS